MLIKKEEITETNSAEEKQLKHRSFSIKKNKVMSNKQGKKLSIEINTTVHRMPKNQLVEMQKITTVKKIMSASQKASVRESHRIFEEIFL